MTEYSCNDINGNPINQFVFQDDGVVYGVVNYEGSQTNYDSNIPYSGEGDLVNITSECCSGMGFNYDSDKGKCYYREVCDVDTQVKVVFNVDQDNGLIFNQEENEQCRLGLSFDYLIQYESDKIYSLIQEGYLVSDILRGLNLSVLIEKTVPKDDLEGVYYENTKTYQTVFSQPIYNITDFTEDTGIILEGNFENIVRNNLQNELGSYYSTSLLDSEWLSANIIISDLNVIDEIIGEEVKFSVLITNQTCDFSLIMDNVNLNKICDIERVERREINVSPSFNMERIVDNKKSWVSSEENRDYTLPIRETYYNTESDKMVINSKEIELSTSVISAVEEDIITYIRNNHEVLEGNGDESTMWGTNVKKLLTTDIDSTKSIHKTLKAIKSELIDAKSRKTLKGYPILTMIHERYLLSEDSNKYDYSKLSDFINMLGGYWVDLIEQVIPATTIWGSTNTVGNNLFMTDKFTYRKYNTLVSNETKEDALASNDVEVIVKEITKNNSVPEIKNHIYIDSFSVGGELSGKVSIVGTNTNNTNNLNVG